MLAKRTWLGVLMCVSFVIISELEFYSNGQKQLPALINRPGLGIQWQNRDASAGESRVSIFNLTVFGRRKSRNLFFSQEKPFTRVISDRCCSKRSATQTLALQRSPMLPGSSFQLLHLPLFVWSTAVQEGNASQTPVLSVISVGIGNG